MSTIIEYNGKSPTPSDNRIVFTIASNDGLVQPVDPDGNNAIGLVLENVSGNLTDGVWDVVEPIEDSPLSFIRLPNIGTELIIALFNTAGVPVPEDLPDDLDRYVPDGLTMTFVGGNTATLAGDFVSIEDSDYAWTVSIEFDTPVNWTTWDGAGGTIGEIVEDFPLNKLVMNEGTAASVLQSDIETWIGEAATDYINDGTTITFSNTGYSLPALTTPSLSALQIQFQNNLLEVVTRCAVTSTFTNLPQLQKLHFLNKDLNNFVGSFLVQNNPLLEEFYWSGWDGSAILNLFGGGLGDVSSLSRIFLPNATGIPGPADNWLAGVTLSTLELWINSVNETNNGGGVQEEVADVIAAGGTVNYNDSIVYPDGFAIPSNENQIWTYWSVNSGNSTFEGKTGSPLEGISLTVDVAQDDRPGMQIDETNAAGFAGLWTDNTRAVGINFTVTGSTVGGVLVGEGSYRFEIDLLIGGDVHSTHTTYFTPGEAVRFDASGITRSLVGRPTISDDQEFASDSIRTIRIRVRTYVGEDQIGEEISSGTKLFWKARLREIDFAAWEPGEWILEKFLTNYPRNEQRLIFPGERYYLSFFYPGTPLSIEDRYHFRYRLETEAGGSAQSTYPLPNIFNFPQTDPFKVGVVNLLNDDWIGVPLENYAILKANLYDVIDDEQVGEQIELTVGDSDCSYGGTVHFMNKLGVMESYYFTRKRMDTAKVSGFGAEVNTGEFDLIENGDIDYLRRAVDSIELRSDWLTEPVQNWLVEEIVESPFILMELSGQLVRVKVSESKWTKRRILNEPIFDTTIKFEIAERRYSPLV